MQIRDAKMMSKTQNKVYAHIKCHSYDILGHLASGCPNKLEKAQANKKKQGNEKHHMIKEEKT
jgi:hypothetical protein